MTKTITFNEQKMAHLTSHSYTIQKKRIIDWWYATGMLFSSQRPNWSITKDKSGFQWLSSPFVTGITSTSSFWTLRKGFGEIQSSMLKRIWIERNYWQLHVSLLSLLDLILNNLINSKYATGFNKRHCVTADLILKRRVAMRIHYLWDVFKLNVNAYPLFLLTLIM